MDQSILLSFFLSLSQAAALALLPLAPVAILCRLINTVQDARTGWTPWIELLALAVGVAGGMVVLAHNLDPATLAAGEIFRKGGPWDLDPAAFLLGPANPLGWSVQPLLPWPYSDNRSFGAGTMVFLVAGAVAYAPVIAFRTRRAAANGLRNALLILWGGCATVYGVCYGLWLLNLLNFWAFLLLLALIQWRRGRSERIAPKLN
ncbi:hypothetical protein [Azospirillum sp. SYSU D00513]|uniref:hypothetical protein n=1 Tax=Azospirillum sp. SYSU D00513 TaxID=2812561 RepID=UPI001A969EEF|nr:hypothetical protein [Azospirillum sp. SYSU D00513]